MDETIKSLLIQSPMVVVLLYAVKTLYLDAKSERAAMLSAVNTLAAKIDLLVAVVVANPEMIDEIKRIYQETNPKL